MNQYPNQQTPGAFPNQFGAANMPGQAWNPHMSMSGYPQQVPMAGHQQQPSGQWGASPAPGPTPPPKAATHGSGTYTPLLDPNIVRPSPVHIQDARTNSTSPPLTASGTSGWQSAQNSAFNGPMAVPGAPPMNQDEGKLSIAIDFGTTFSGVAYGSSRIAAGTVQQILHWPGSFETFRKIPTCLLFKLFLEPKALRDDAEVDPRLPRLPPGKKPIDAIIDFLSALWDYAKEQITREIGSVADLNSADVWFTVPAAWDAKGCSIMREAAITAGLVQSARAGDRNWRDRLRIITEPEAAAVHCAHLTNLHHLKPGQNFMICDAGGGTVDLAVYRTIGQLQNLEIAEVCARSGANCGSIFLDLRFRELVKTLLADHPAHLDNASLAYFMHSFSETDKITYEGESQDEMMFHFTCFNVEDPDDPSVGLFNGELSIPGNLLRREVFDPVINEVLQLIEDQLKRTEQVVDALMLVGGFSGSEYLFKRVDERFGTRIKVIARPSDADTATLRGAAQYGLARRPLVSSVVAPRAYIMRVKLPAEHEDYMKRPAYIHNNPSGVPICENRLKYLVHKGAIIRKGQMIRAPFCKYSANAADRMFVAVLYTSEVDREMRYTDEGETTELCKWTVDLGTLPTFQNAPPNQGFYTGTSWIGKVSGRVAKNGIASRRV
ncbi:hypothetical protein PIIN_07352 [Serendipita indica DSM 11827]|uniref:Actin-like ATPase domain-containing protein n=1 Tax=Serendipita indica (strain DSM 11827) TaxID=1109443 RepID=G4TQ05_SERID|nr:hypothetical protein PIIN_07352 [Serendipita indica DSM 11827]